MIDPLSFLAGIVFCLLFSGLIVALFFASAPISEDSMEFCYWRKGVPVPAGWEMADDFAGTHHGEYAILLKKGKDNADITGSSSIFCRAD